MQKGFLNRTKYKAQSKRSENIEIKNQKQKIFLFKAHNSPYIKFWDNHRKKGDTDFY